VTWDRLLVMRHILKYGNYDWVYCCGTDTLHTNFRIKLEEFADENFHVIASSEWCSPFQADSFMIRKSTEGISYIEHILSLYGKYKNHVWVEQQAMIDTLPKFKEIIKLLPQRRMNSYDYTMFESKYPKEERVKRGVDIFGNDGRWRPGDFLIHWPSIPMPIRIAEIIKTIPLIVK
jgi:hypothetical protein